MFNYFKNTQNYSTHMSVFWKITKKQLVPKNKLISKTIVLLGLFINLAFVCYVNIYFFEIGISWKLFKKILGLIGVLFCYLKLTINV